MRKFCRTVQDRDHSKISRCFAVAVVAFLTVALASCSDKSKEKKSAETEEHSGPPVAAITPAAAKAAGIMVAVAGPASVSETITLYGTVKENAEREQSLRARYPGTVRSVNKRVGDRVARGEQLLTVESSESLQSYALASPISGTVLERNANAGESVDSTTVLMRVADLSILWVEFAVFARDLGRVHTGLPVRISANDGNIRVDTQLTYVAPAGASSSQSVVARAEVSNSDGHWVPGQFVTGELAVSQVRAPVAVMPGAIQTLNGHTVVFVAVPKGFEARTVTVGRSSADEAEITAGLKVGERYAAANSYLVKADLTKGAGDPD